MALRDFNRAAVTQRTTQKTGGGRRFPPREVEELSFEVDETFLLRAIPVPAPYLRAYHWPDGSAPLACTLEHPLFNGKCSYCHAWPDKDDKGRRRTVTVMEFIDFRYHHVVPQERNPERDTLTRCKHDEPELPKRLRCTLCTDGADRHFGGHKVLEMNVTQWDQLWSAHQKLQERCIGTHNGEVCGKGNYPVSYICANPACGVELIGEDELQKMPAKQLNQILTAVQQCGTCGHEDFLWGIYLCDNGGRSPTPAEEAELMAMTPEERAETKPEDSDHWVTRASMFDMILELTITGSQKKYGKKTFDVKNFNFSTGAGWSTLEEDLSHHVDPADIEAMIQPWDLSDRFKPEKIKPEEYSSEEEYVEAVLDAQAEQLGKDWVSPWKRSAGGAGAFGAAKKGLRSFGATK